MTEQSGTAEGGLTTFDDLARLVHIGTWEWRPESEQDGREVVWSPEMYRIFGLDPAQHEPSFERYLESVARPDRERTRQAILRTLETGEPFDHEERIVRPDGVQRWLRSIGERIERGGVMVLFGTCQDITDKKDLRVRLARCRRMETAARMATGLAHDFNNLIAVVSLCASALEVEDLSPRARERVADILEATDRASSLARQLLAVGRADEPAKSKPIDLGQILRDLEPTVRHTVGESVSVQLTVPEEPLTFEGSVEHVERIVVNLCKNARDAMPEGGELTLEADVTRVRPRTVACYAHADAGHYVRLQVRDTGEGFDDTIADEIFEPFVTTKGDHGTGLGLATVDGLVTQAGGFVVCESEPGAGATFSVHWPRVARESPPETQADEGEGGAASGTSSA